MPSVPETPSDDISRSAGAVRMFEGTVVSDPDSRGDHVQLIVEADRARTGAAWTSVSGKVEVSLATGDPKMPIVHYGDRLEIAAVPYPPAEPTNPGAFRWADHLASEGIYACASVRSPKQVRILPGGGGNPIVASGLAAKRYVTESIERIHPSPESSVVTGVVLGTYAYLPPDILRNFSRTGTLHLLVASGFNCYILLVLATPLLKTLRISPRWRGIAIVLILLAYMEIVGTMHALVRAALMASLWHLAPLFRRAPNRKNLFFTAGLALLAWNPLNLFDVGFQLSFLSIWALLVVAPVLGTALRRRGMIGPLPPKRAHWRTKACRKAAAIAAQAAVATIAISLVTMPVMAYFFNYVSLVSVPANMAMAFCQTLSFVDGAVSGLVAPLGPVGAVWGWAGSWLARLMLGIVNGLGSMKYAAVSVATPSLAAIIGYYLILYAGLVFVRSKYVEG